MRQVSQTFADMIYMHGYVHADPHENNLMVSALLGAEALGCAARCPHVPGLRQGLVRRFAETRRGARSWCFWTMACTGACIAHLCLSGNLN